MKKLALGLIAGLLMSGTAMAETVKVAVIPTGMAAFCGEETVGPGISPATTFTLARAMGVKVNSASTPC